MRCPACLSEDSMRPDVLTVGRHLVCAKCNGTWIPGGSLRHECGSCGRSRCPSWMQLAVGVVCGRWRPVRRVETWTDAEMFGGDQ